MFLGVSRRMSTVNGNENAVPTDLGSSPSESSAKTPKSWLEQVGANDLSNETEDGDTDPPPKRASTFWTER